MIVQFSHSRNNTIGADATIAVKVLNRENLERIFLNHANKTILCIGLTVKSPLDQFVKKIGRDTAFKNMTMTYCELNKVIQIGTKHVYYFSTAITHNRKDYKITTVFTTIAETNESRLVDFYIERK